MDLVTALRIKIEKEIEANESLLSQVLEAIGYVDNLLEDLQADEPTLENPKELLEFIGATLYDCQTKMSNDAK